MELLAQVTQIVNEFRHYRAIVKKLKELDLYDAIPDSGHTHQQSLYNFVYPDRIKVCTHSNMTKFVSFSVGYRYCGNASTCECCNTSVKTNVSATKQAYDDATKSSINKKRTDTVMCKYGVGNVAQDDNVKTSSRDTKRAKYGDENYNNREKAQVTCTELYGVDNPGKSAHVQSKMTETCIERYGVTSPLLSDDVRSKISGTLFEKYGVYTAFASQGIRDKATGTVRSRYGVDNPAKADHVKCKIKTNLRSVLYDRMVCRYKDEVDFAFTKEEYITGITTPLICKQCDSRIHSGIINGLVPRCKVCYPRGSKFEHEVCDALDAHSISYTTQRRDIISPLELDVYVEQCAIAIECNGSYWHSENQGKDKNYHLTKTAMCKDRGIQLIHIWEHDWYHKRDIVIGRLLSKLSGASVIYGRSTKVSTVSGVDATLFLDTCHIQGSCPASVNLGLYYNNELVALMTFGKSRYKKDIEWELIRYCSKLGTNVVGGAGKLFKHFVKEYEPNTVISYSDRMWNTGRLYTNLGFTYARTTPPAYYYTLDYTMFENRVAYQKHKLQDKLDVFDPNLTEWENMQANGFDRIWDCGNDVWVYNKTIKGNI